MLKMLGFLHNFDEVHPSFSTILRPLINGFLITNHQLVKGFGNSFSNSLVTTFRDAVTVKSL